MQKVGWVRVRLSGRMSGRRLNEASARMMLKNVRQLPGGMELDIKAGNLNRLRHILRGSGLSMRIVRRYGIVRVRRWARRQKTLLCAGICTVMVMLYLSQTALEVRIEGAKDEAQEVRMLQVLEQCGIQKGVCIAKVDKTAAAECILRECSGLTYAALRRKGTALELYVVQATQKPEIYDAAAETEVVASAGGLVTRVVTLSGEALVQPGDTVVEGQVLIGGTERMPHARGAVTARVWAVGKGEAAAQEAEYVRTGRTHTHTALRIGNREFSVKKDSGFAQEETEREEVLLLDGLFCPMEVIKSIHHETKLEVKKRTISEMKDESGARAMTNALLALKNGARVVDKRVEYSMIEDGKLCAAATLECVMQIGRERPVGQAAADE